MGACSSCCGRGGSTSIQQPLTPRPSVTEAAAPPFLPRDTVEVMTPDGWDVGSVTSVVLGNTGLDGGDFGVPMVKVQMQRPPRGADAVPPPFWVPALSTRIRRTL